jgi:hypothetical protein
MARFNLFTAEAACLEKPRKKQPFIQPYSIRLCHT